MILEELHPLHCTKGEERQKGRIPQRAQLGSWKYREVQAKK